MCIVLHSTLDGWSHHCMQKYSLLINLPHPGTWVRVWVSRYCQIACAVFHSFQALVSRIYQSYTDGEWCATRVECWHRCICPPVTAINPTCPACTQSQKRLPPTTHLAFDANCPAPLPGSSVKAKLPDPCWPAEGNTPEQACAHHALSLMLSA